MMRDCTNTLDYRRVTVEPTIMPRPFAASSRSSMGIACVSARQKMRACVKRACVDVIVWYEEKNLVNAWNKACVHCAFIVFAFIIFAFIIFAFIKFSG